MSNSELEELLGLEPSACQQLGDEDR